MLAINPKRILLGAIIIGVGLGVTYLAKKRSPNKDDAKLDEVRKIYSSLPIPPGFKEAGSSFQSKAESALTVKYFESQTSYDDVKTFYAQRLSESGWSLSSERPITDWGRDFGGRRLEFRKGEYSLVVEYSGEKSTEQENYAITLIWKTG